jgi:subtilase family serine protease
VQISQPGQAYIEEDVTPPDVLFSLPANFPGRNVPDVSMNADPQTGYVLYYTSSVSGFHIETGEGGTSFVAPQLNGVTALMDQNARHRLGLLNYALYLLAHFPTTYAGSHAPLRYIIDGDNWFYSGRQGYSPAAGVGTIDVANLAQLLQ